MQEKHPVQDALLAVIVLLNHKKSLAQIVILYVWLVLLHRTFAQTNMVVVLEQLHQRYAKQDTIQIQPRNSVLYVQLVTNAVTNLLQH